MSPLLLSLLFVFFLASDTGATAFNYTKETKRVSALRLARIQKHLQKINKPAVKSIVSPDGDVIDCVHHNDQPALDHPLLKNHRVQKVAPPIPNNNTTRAAPEVGAWQEWSRLGHCPEGTVPIRRSTVDSVLRAKSLYHYGKKLGKMSSVTTKKKTSDAGKKLGKMSSVTTKKKTSDAEPAAVGGGEHEHAIVYTEKEVYGAKASMNVWKPSIGEATEFSVAQIWLVAGSFDAPDDLNTIEAGWQVHPELFGDSNPRLFVFWTIDGYGGTGCYNLLCPGFVQISNKIAIGTVISPVSTYSGKQYEVSILIWKDPKEGHWWLNYVGETVGYWPAEIFTGLREHSTHVEWGGEVVNVGADGKHTSTQMGSGHFPEEGHGRASYFRNLQTVDSGNSLIGVESVTTFAEKSNCYSIKTFSSKDKEWGTYFYYGGPGNNPNCP